MRTNALPSSARKNSCVLHDVRPGAFDVRKRASLRQLCLGLKGLHTCTVLCGVQCTWLYSVSIRDCTRAQYHAQYYEP